MCGRFTQMMTWEELHALYAIHERPRSNLEPRYNIAPTQTIAAVVEAEGERRLEAMRWGLVPAWWKKPLKDLPSTFNARAETVAEKPMFRSAYKARRCVVPASGFFEWTGEKGHRQPWYITRADGQPLSLAGLWERWSDPETGEDILSATIIVCEANAFMSKLHHRMPVVLAAEQIGDWLDAPRPELLVPAPEGSLQAWQVSPQVNSSRYQGTDTVEPLQAS